MTGIDLELYRIHLRIRTTSEIAVPILWKLSLIIIPLIIVISAVLGYVLRGEWNCCS